MSDQNSVDLVVIGAGPGGYATAFMAADLGLSVTVIDPEKNPGGVCLYRGCIPSKSLLHAAQMLNHRQHAAGWGITYEAPKIDLDRLRGKVSQIVDSLTKGLGQLSGKRNITYLQGRARFIDSSSLEVNSDHSEKKKVVFDNAVIATGSTPTTLPFFPDNHPMVMDSTEALKMTTVPKSLLVVGGGYIGLELGTVYAALGSEVTVVEMMPGLLEGVDRDMVRILTKKITSGFTAIHLDTKVVSAVESGKEMMCRLSFKDGTTNDIAFERILVAVGRQPNTSDLGLENTKAIITTEGFIKTDERNQTDDPAIYAVGDVAGQPMLAHKATHEGRVVAEIIAGKKVLFDPRAIPAVVFTDPEIAWCGLTETQAKKEKIPHETVRFPWAASGRALSQGISEGMTKLIVDPESERIMGMGVVGNNAGELIAQGVLAIEMAALASDVGMTIHPHPTLSETIMEAADVFYGTSTHLYRPKRKKGSK